MDFNLVSEVVSELSKDIGDIAAESIELIDAYDFITTKYVIWIQYLRFLLRDRHVLGSMRSRPNMYHSRYSNVLQRLTTLRPTTDNALVDSSLKVGSQNARLIVLL